MDGTYSLQDATNDLANIWDKLTNQQRNYIAKLAVKIKEKDNAVLKNQITIDEFITELEENYRRKISSGN